VTDAWYPGGWIDRTGMPWLTASKLPDLIRFVPQRREDGTQGNLPTHIRTPDGKDLPVFGEDLAAEVGRRYGAPVEMMQLRHGIFDEACISVIALDTVREIGRLAGRSLDVRRFRPNIVVRSLRSVPFQEDEWLGGVLSFGKEDDDDAPAITVTMRDERCSMVNLDPDSASPAPEVMKAVIRANQNTAGIYGAVTRIGRLAVGQTIHLRAATGTKERGVIETQCPETPSNPARACCCRSFGFRVLQPSRQDLGLVPCGGNVS
jgi:hypothetical protein